MNDLINVLKEMHQAIQHREWEVVFKLNKKREKLFNENKEHLGSPSSEKEISIMRHMLKLNDQSPQPHLHYFGRDTSLCSQRS